MNFEFLLFNGYGQFVWAAFIFTFVSCLLLYLNAKKELVEQEKILFNKLKQTQTTKIRIIKHKQVPKEIFSGSISF